MSSERERHHNAEVKKRERLLDAVAGKRSVEPREESFERPGIVGEFEHGFEVQIEGERATLRPGQHSFEGGEAVEEWVIGQHKR
jgi:hypothetical protein